MTTSVYGVLFDEQGRVLLVKDAHSNAWGFPGGKIEPGETHDDALRREFQEETGMQLVGAVTFIARQDDAQRHKYFYRIEGVTGHMRTSGNGDDVLEAAYFDVANLPVHIIAAGIQHIVDSCK